MPTLTATPPRTKHNVGMGQILVGRENETLEAVLGSCVGVMLYQPRIKIAALAHVVLPAANGRGGPPGKFADTAIPEMLRLLAEHGVLTPGLSAKIVGGANMFGNAGGPIQIGESNAQAVTEQLARHGLRLEASDLGGTRGRRVTVNCRTGIMEIEAVNAGKLTL